MFGYFEYFINFGFQRTFIMPEKLLPEIKYSRYMMKQPARTRTRRKLFTQLLMSLKISKANIFFKQLL
jgi:hypothetical protein